VDYPRDCARCPGLTVSTLDLVIGAIYADSGVGWSAFQLFVDTIGYPRSASQQLALRAKVQTQLSSDSSFMGKVTVDEVEIAGAQSCRSMREASVLASHRAVQILVI
jgi:hypothetical protein